MKKTAIVLTTMVITLGTLFTACKKDAKSDNSIIGKWNITKSITLFTYDDGSTSRDTTIGHSAEYVDFRADGKAYSCLWKESANNYVNDTSSYKVEGTNLILNGTDTAQIQILTSTNMTLYGKNKGESGSGYFYEYWTYFTK